MLQVVAGSDGLVERVVVQHKGGADANVLRMVEVTVQVMICFTLDFLRCDGEAAHTRKARPSTTSVITRGSKMLKQGAAERVRE